MSSNTYALARIPIVKRPRGYYLRWYYNGWHYWQFFAGQLGVNSDGEKYRTYGVRTLAINSGQLTEGQVSGLRTILNSKETYILTTYGWMALRIDAGSVKVYDNQFGGYEMQLTATIGSRLPSTVTGLSPVVPPVVIPPAALCETVIGTQIWLCKNWDAAYPSSKVYDNDEANRAKFGGLYTYDQVNSAGFVPEGWDFPTIEQWRTLIAYVGGFTIGGGKLKQAGTTNWVSPNAGADNAFGFDGLGAGHYHIWINPDWSVGVGFANLFRFAYFWAKSPEGTLMAYVLAFDTGEILELPYVPATNPAYTAYHSVRFIKNTPPPVPVATAGAVVGHNWFTANWDAIAGISEYHLDVSTDPAFGSFVTGYNDLNVGNVATKAVLGTSANTTYYYRVRSVNAVGESASSNVITIATPAAMLISARGTGGEVAWLKIKVQSPIYLTLTGTARFYSDAAGTTGESITALVNSGYLTTLYIRCPSGTSDLMFSDLSQLVAFGGCVGVSSGTASWSYDTLHANPANVPFLDCTNWLYPNCVDIGMFYGSIQSFSVAVSALSRTLQKIIVAVTGTITGDLTDMPATCTIFGIQTGNTIMGNVSSLPSGMLAFACAGSNTVTGNTSNLPRGLTEILLTGINTLDGDVANLPSTLTSFYVSGLNTLYGNVGTMPSGLLSISLFGYNVVSGNISGLPAGAYNVQVGGYNTLSGLLGTIPTTSGVFIIDGYNTIGGNINALPSGLGHLRINGSNTVSGDITNLPTNLYQLTIAGSNTVTGNLSTLKTAMVHLAATGGNTIYGALASLPANVNFFYINGTGAITGDLANIPTVCNYLMLGSGANISAYTSRSWAGNSYYIFLAPTSGGLSSAAVDQLLIDLNGSSFAGYYRTVYLMGTNGARTGASSAAVASLIAKGVNVTTH
jgi:uncharacterized protein (TIGR02145 family)